MSFALVHLAPMDPARFFVQFRPGVREEQVRAMRDWYGLDDPIPVQYVRWTARALTGDFGRSITSGREIGPEIGRRIPWTLVLTAVAFALAWALAIPLAVVGLRNGPGGRLAQAVTTSGLLMPGFLLASLLVYVFAVRLTWIPILPPFELKILDADLWRSLLLPAISLGLPAAAVIARDLGGRLRANHLATHVAVARAKGLPARGVFWRHLVRVAARPVVVRPLPVLSLLLGGAIVVEDIFGWPGIARVFMRAVVQRDITVIQASLWILAVLVIMIELAMRVLADRHEVPVPDDAMTNAGKEAEKPRPVPPFDRGTKGAIVLGALLLAAIVAAPLIVRFPPDQVLLEEIQLGPSARHWMGTDASGRDLFSRLLYAGRVTLALAALPAVAAVVAAVGLAALGIWHHPMWRDLTVAAARPLQAMPAVALALSVVAVAGRAPVMVGGLFAVLALAVVAARVRGLVASASGWGFVDAGIASGAAPPWIGERHLLPHMMRPLAGAALSLVPGLLLLEATLGFFGFSLTPTIPTWGTLLWRGREALHRGDWWLLAFPAGFVVLAAWASLRLSDALADPPSPTFIRVTRLAVGPGWSVAATDAAGRGAPARRPVASRVPKAPAPAAATGGGAPGGAANGES